MSAGGGQAAQLAIHAAGAHQAQAVDLAHDDVVGGRAGRAAVDHAQLGQFGVQRAADAGRRDAEQRLRCHQPRLGHIEHAGGIEHQVGGAPAGTGARPQRGGGGAVVQRDLLQRIIEAGGAHHAGAGGDHQGMVVELDRRSGSEAVEHQAVVAGAADQVEHTGQRGGDQVVSGTGIDGVERAVDADGVVAAATEEGVLAGAHVDELGALAADEAVVAIAAPEIQAAARAADEFVLARTAADLAARRPAQDHEAVVADAAVEVQRGIDPLVHVDEIVALAAGRNDATHLRRTVGLGLAQRTHEDLSAVGASVDVERLVDRVVVQRAAAVAARLVAHVQVQRTVVGQVADVGRRAPAPGVAARHGDAHHRGPRRQVGRGRGDVDLAAETGDGEIDLEQAEVELEIQRAPGRCGKARLAAEQHAHAGVQVQRAQVDVELGLAAHLEVAFGRDVTADIDPQRIEEIQPAVELELEDLVDHAHAAAEVDVEGQNLQRALELQVEQRVGRQHVVLQRGVVQAAGVDAQLGSGVDVHHRHAHLYPGTHHQRKERLIVGVHAEGCRASHADLAEVAEVERDVHRRLHTPVVDQQIDRATQLDRADLDGRAASDAQRLCGDHHLGRPAAGVEEGAGDRVAAAHLLALAGGVDLQQELARHAEHAAAIDDGGVGVVAADLESAVQPGVAAVDHEAQRAGHAEGFKHRQIEHRGGAQFQGDGTTDLGHDQREVALQRQRTVEQVERAVAREGGIHAGPRRVLARRVGADGEAVEAGERAELFGHLVGDVAAEGVQAQVQLGVERGHRAQVEVGAQVQAQRHPAAVDHHQAGGLAAQVEAVGADLQLDIGEGGQAFGFAQAEVEHAVELDQAEHVDLHRAIQPQVQLAVVEHDGLARVAGLDGITRPGRAVGVVGVHPGAAAEIDGGERHRDIDIGVVADRAAGVAHELADVQREARAGVDLDDQVVGRGHHAGHAGDEDRVHRGPAGQVDADVDAGGVDHQFLGHHQAQVQVTNDQAHGLVVDGVALVDAVIAVAVVEIAAATHRNADEGIGIVDADGQRGDDGLLAIAQRDALGPALGQRHRRRQLGEAGQVDLGVADLGLHDLLAEVEEHHVAAAGSQRKAGAVDLAVLVAVFAGVQRGIAVAVFGEIPEAGAQLVIDRRRAEQLQRQIYRRRCAGDDESVDVDLDILGPHFQDVGVDADQRCRLDTGLGGDELRRVLAHAGDQRGQRRRHQRQAEIDVGDLHAHGGGTDAVEDAVGCAVRAGQVFAIAVRAAHAGKAGEVGAAQRQGRHLQRERVQHRAGGAADLLEQRRQAAGVDRDVDDVALAEGQ